LDPENEITIILSKIIDIKIASLISTRIDNKTDEFINIGELYLPYEFKLLLRGSRDGFTPRTFHALCDDKPITVTFIKVKGTEEILGGYNPITWKSTNVWDCTKDSFIFSFKNKSNFIKDAILSNIRNIDCTLIFIGTIGYLIMILKIYHLSVDL